MTEFNAQKTHTNEPMPLCPDEFQENTQGLTANQTGAYMRLLMVMWSQESCDLPNDDAVLARAARVPLHVWHARMWPYLRDLFTEENGRIFSKSLREEARLIECGTPTLPPRNISKKGRTLQ